MAKKPGENTGKNGGIYQEVGPRGGKKDNFATVKDNERLPPTTKPGHGWVLDKRNSRQQKVIIKPVHSGFLICRSQNSTSLLIK